MPPYSYEQQLAELAALSEANQRQGVHEGYVSPVRYQYTYQGPPNRGMLGPPAAAQPTERETRHAEAAASAKAESSKRQQLQALYAREEQLTSQVAEIQTALKAIGAHRAALEKELDMGQTIIEPWKMSAGTSKK